MKNASAACQVDAFSNGIDQVKQGFMPAVVELDDPDIPSAAPAAFHSIALLLGEPAGDHIVDLAGNASQLAG